MGHVMGMASLLLAVLFVFIPLLGAPLTALSTALALFSRRGGEGKGLVAVILNLVNALLLSPMTGWNLQRELASGGWKRTVAFLALVGFHALAAGLLIFWLRRRPGPTPAD